MEYRFYFDELGTLYCDVDTINSSKTYIGRDAFAILEKMDRYSFTQGRLARDEAILYAEHIKCIFEDYHMFFKARILDAAPYTKRSCMEMISNVRLREARRQKKRLKQLKQAVTKVVVSAAVLAILTYGGIKIIDMINDNDDTLDEPTIGITEVEDEFSDFIEEYGVPNEDNMHTNLPITHDDTVGHNIPLDINTSTTTIKPDEDVDTIYLDFRNEFNSEKGQYAYDNYYPLAEIYANKWGLSPNIIMSMLTQESGGYVEDNLMQIQFYSWEGQVIYVHNFESGKDEMVVLTNNPQKFKSQYGDDIICITEQELKNPATNISASCIIMRESLRVMNKHFVAGLQCYNLGCGNMWNVFDEMEDKTGNYPDLTDQEDCEFLEYLYVAKGGDKNYVTNVVRYNKDVDEEFVFRDIDEYGNITEERIAILPRSYT